MDDDQRIVVVGNIVEGFRFYGPFPDFETASDWADSNIRASFETYITTLHTTPEFSNDAG
jgi:hypothetical protein